jgi:hypothetical protein
LFLHLGAAALPLRLQQCSLRTAVARIIVGKDGKDICRVMKITISRGIGRWVLLERMKSIAVRVSTLLCQWFYRLSQVYLCRILMMWRKEGEERERDGCFTRQPLHGLKLRNYETTYSLYLLLSYYSQCFFIPQIKGYGSTTR